MDEVPVEPPPSRWALPDATTVGADQEIVGVGADLAPGTLLAAYRHGLFPMRLQFARSHRTRSDRLVVAEPTRDHPTRRAHREPDLAPFDATLRDPDRHRVRSGDARLRRSRDDPTGGSTRSSSPPTPSCTGWDGRTASRRGRTTDGVTVSSSAGSTACASEGCSPRSRSSIGSPTRRRSRSSRSWTCCERVGARCSTCSGRRRTSRRSVRSTWTVSGTASWWPTPSHGQRVTTFPDVDGR